MKKAAIGLGTSKRPKMLSQTLNSLVSLNIPEGVDVELLLVDNAPEEPSKDVFDTYAKKLSFQAHYFTEASRGIVHMRNRILEEALAGDFDYLSFIDDDEIVSPDWLRFIFDAMSAYDADVISGRTLRILPRSTPAWIKEAGFFDKGKRATGIQRSTSSTCNVTFDVKKLGGDWKMRFDERLNFVGSSDVLFFNQAHRKGAKIVWSNEAIVEEIIPESRATQDWLIQRAFRIGNTMSVRYRIQNPLLLAYVKGILFAIGEWLTALPLYFQSGNFSHPEIAFTKRKHHQNIAKGILNGLFGKKVYEEYRQQHHGH
ncbi:MAG: glycosyltransferase family 2 protein [Cyclobacteriaceae bacterium]|nr:glycosyltransferase family 2 protein [Cyclobacteriaceae bacterium HetDA_MAG_MS6]